jgi:CubicO group peptidase (beta-lactamase class C family)
MTGALRRNPIHRLKSSCAAAFFLAAFGLALPAGARQPQDATGDGEPAGQLDRYFATFASGQTPGCAVMVKQAGQTVLAKGYGVRDLRSLAPIDARTNFRLASLTKQFTAMAVMLLVGDGKLRYDQSLAEILPGFPAYGKSITVRQLLNHTGGLPDYEDLMEALERQKGPVWSPERQIQDAEVLELLEKERAGKFPPGTRWEYSNSGYVVLGLIVARISGKPFGEFLQERIFSPLGMRRTLVFEKNRNQVPDRAYGHAKTSAFILNDQSSTSATQGDGGIYSNLEDLSKWDQALGRHTLLGEAEFQPAISPAALPPGVRLEPAEEVPLPLRGKAAAYGFGWFLNLPGAHPLMWHYGDTAGFKTAILRYFRDQAAVILLCNRSDIDAGAISLKTAAMALPQTR